MTPEEIVRKRLEARIKRLRRQVVTISAEIEMTERYLAGVEKEAVRPRLKFRKNSQAKWSIQGQVRQLLLETDGPIRARTILDRLRTYDSQLKSSTFRSHIKRMADSGIIKQQGMRGHYQLVERPDGDTTVDDREGGRSGPRRIRVPIRYR